MAPPSGGAVRTLGNRQQATQGQRGTEGQSDSGRSDSTHDFRQPRFSCLCSCSLFPCTSLPGPSLPLFPDPCIRHHIQATAVVLTYLCSRKNSGRNVNSGKKTSAKKNSLFSFFTLSPAFRLSSKGSRTSSLGHVSPNRCSCPSAECRCRSLRYDNGRAARPPDPPVTTCLFRSSAVASSSVP